VEWEAWLAHRTSGVPRSYFKFFTATDTLELAQFGAAQVTTCQDIRHWDAGRGTCTQYNRQHGAITHFDANICE
jgi:hypothetical protein